MEQFQIDEVCPKGPVYPMLVNFQNGYVTKDLKSKSCNLLEHEESGRKTIAAEINGIMYAGEEDIEDIGKTLVLARSRTTGKTRLIEVSTANLRAFLQPDVDTSVLLETSNLELSRKFGSKKQKQQMEHREKLKVNTETVTNQMQSVTELMTEDKLDLSQYNKSDSDNFYLPVIDRTADKVENVYSFDNILTEEEYEKVYLELQDQDYTSGMTLLLSSIVAKKSNIPEKHVVLAVYADSLLKMYGIMAKDLVKKSFVACSVSPTLNQIILANFTVLNNGKRGRPAPYKDKTLCYAIVMILLINSFKFELDGLCSCIKLTPTSIITKVKVTGASVIDAAGKKIVQLKLPLNTKSTFRRQSAKF